ncbi:hypothetical protein G7046_g30 [Stylonectria norvegica]|nr:hypothetical protein G7046_g30 [Stylonectria norvegica]
MPRETRNNGQRTINYNVNAALRNLSRVLPGAGRQSTAEAKTAPGRTSNLGQDHQDHNPTKVSSKDAEAETSVPLKRKAHSEPAEYASPSKKTRRQSVPSVGSVELSQLRRQYDNQTETLEQVKKDHAEAMKQLLEQHDTKIKALEEAKIDDVQRSILATTDLTTVKLEYDQLQGELNKDDALEEDIQAVVAQLKWEKDRKNDLSSEPAASTSSKRKAECEPTQDGSPSKRARAHPSSTRERNNLREVRARYKAQSDELDATKADYEATAHENLDLKKVLKARTTALQKATAENAVTAHELSDFKNQLKAKMAALEKANKANQDLIKSNREIAKSLSESQAKQTSLQHKFDLAKSIAKKLTEKIDEMKESKRLLEDRNVNLEDQLDAQNRDSEYYSE